MRNISYEISRSRNWVRTCFEHPSCWTFFDSRCRPPKHRDSERAGHLDCSFGILLFWHPQTQSNCKIQLVKGMFDPLLRRGRFGCQLGKVSKDTFNLAKARMSPSSCTQSKLLKWCRYMSFAYLPISACHLLTHVAQLDSLEQLGGGKGVLAVFHAFHWSSWRENNYRKPLLWSANLTSGMDPNQLCQSTSWFLRRAGMNFTRINEV